MVTHAALPSHHDPIAGGGAARHTHLRTDHVVLAEPAVVRDHHKVVDLCAVANHCGSVGAPVNRGVGPNLSIISNLDPAELGGYRIGTIHNLVPKSVGAHGGARMDEATLADASVFIEYGIGKNDRASSDPTAGHDPGTGVDDRPDTNLHICADRGQRIDIHIRCDPRGMVHNSQRAHADPLGRSRRPEANNCQSECPMHIGHFYRWTVQRARARRHDRGAGAAFGKQMDFVSGVDQRDVLGAGRFERGGADDLLRLSVGCGGSSTIEKRAAELVGKDFECQCHRQFSRSGSPASNAGGSGKTRSLTGTDAR